MNEYFYLNAKMTKRRRGYIVYLKEAEKIGIARNRSVTYENDAKGVELNFRAVGKAISKAVENKSMMNFVDDDWADEIQAYKERRK